MQKKEEINTVSKISFDIPENIREYLRIEDCSNFDVSKYFKTKEQAQIINEITIKRNTAAEMLKMGVPLLNSTLLYGPTGTGKTTMCRYIAHKHKLPFAYINFASLIEGGVFGKTALNLTRIFESLLDKECVFTLDEIDCIAVNRDRNEAQANGGELKRITITLMQLMDLFEQQRVQSIIIGCTNRVEDLDPALRSRFKLKKQIGLLTIDEKKSYIQKYLKNVNTPYTIDYDVNNITEYCLRGSMLGMRDMEADIKAALARWIENGHEGFELIRIRDDDLA